MTAQPTENNLRYIAYVRKSSEAKERQAPSIPAQIEEIERAFPGINIIEFVEESRSAFRPYNRPEFDAMMEKLRAGKADGIVVWHPNRLSRNEVDAAAITWDIREGVIKDLKFVTYTFENNPQGIWMLQSALSQAQYESASKSVDVKRGLAKKIRAGWLPGEAPTGYINTPDRDKGFKVVLPDPERFPLVRRMWDLMLTGSYQPPKILRIANEDWGFRTRTRGKKTGGPLSRSAIYKIFTSTFYHGEFEYPRGSGNWWSGQHQPMVTREEYDRVQVLLGSKGHQSQRKREFAFTGTILCGECGGQITAEVKLHCVCTGCGHKFSCINRQSCVRCDLPLEKMQTPTIRNYTLYRCSKNKVGKKCRQPSVNVKDLEAQIESYLSTIEIDQDYLNWAIKHLRKAGKLEATTQREVRRSQQRAYDQCSERLNTLSDKFLDGLFTDDEFERKKKELMAKRDKAEQALKSNKHRQDQWLEVAERTFTFAAKARTWFREARERGDLQRQREILVAFGSNLTLKDKKLLIEAPKPLTIIREGLSEVPEAAASFEPAGSAVQLRDKAKQAVAASPDPRWFRDRDSNPDLVDQNHPSCH